MTLQFHPLTPNFAAEVTGIDTSRPLTQAEAAAIEAGMDRHAVLVFRDQPLTDDQQLAFARNFGTIEITLARQMAKPGDARLREEMGDISNLDANNQLRPRDDARRLYALGNRLWHADASFRAEGATYSLLSARIVPGSGGNTEFADMRAAHDALDAKIKAQIDNLVTEHSIAYSRGELGFEDFNQEHSAKLNPVRHPLVLNHPVTRRHSLFLSAHIGGIVGWPVPEARAFLRDLTEHATQRQFVHAHAWRVNDLVIWDNRTTMHRARRYNDAADIRDLRRTSLRGAGPYVSQALAAE